jgi:hypothetical protein
VPEKTPSNSRDNSLLAEIELDVLDLSVPLSDVLLKCVALSRELGSPWLHEWAISELNGYTSNTIPTYRVIRAPVHLMNVTIGYHEMPQHITSQQLPDAARAHVKEEIFLTQPMCELEAFSRLTGPLWCDYPDAAGLTSFLLAQRWISPSIRNIQHIGSIHLMLLPTTVMGVVSRIRTILTVFIRDLRADMPADQKIPSAARTDQAVAAAIPRAVTVTAGKGSTVNLNENSRGVINNAADSGPAYTPTRRSWPVIGWMLAFLVAVVGTYAGLGQWLQWPAPWK